MMDGHLGCKSQTDPTNQTELDALAPMTGNDKVWEASKEPTWAEVLAKQTELNKTATPSA